MTPARGGGNTRGGGGGGEGGSGSGEMRLSRTRKACVEPLRKPAETLRPTARCYENVNSLQCQDDLDEFDDRLCWVTVEEWTATRRVAHTLGRPPRGALALVTRGAVLEESRAYFFYGLTFLRRSDGVGCRVRQRCMEGQQVSNTSRGPSIHTLTCHRPLPPPAGAAGCPRHCPASPPPQAVPPPRPASPPPHCVTPWCPKSQVSRITSDG